MQLEANPWSANSGFSSEIPVEHKQGLSLSSHSRMWLCVCLGRSHSLLSNSSLCLGFLQGSWPCTLSLGNDKFYLACSQGS